LLASVVGYFFYIVTAFVAVMALLIDCADHSTLEMRRHPSPVVELVLAAKVEDRHLQVTPETEDRSVRNLPGKKTKGADVATFAKPKPSKIDHFKTLAHVEIPKVFVRLRGNYDERRFGVALGYAEESAYDPGLSAQR
jgi:hypothetical protein